MMNFDVGYPKRTGDDKQDLINLYNFACELSDRLRYVFNQLDTKPVSTTAEDTGEAT